MRSITTNVTWLSCIVDHLGCFQNLDGRLSIILETVVVGLAFPFTVPWACAHLADITTAGRGCGPTAKGHGYKDQNLFPLRENHTSWSFCQSSDRATLHMQSRTS